MGIKKLIIVLMVMTFSLGFAGVSISAQEIKGTVGTDMNLLAGSEKVVTGTISKIEGNKIILLKETGDQIAVTVQDPKALKDLKVGDKVSVKDGKVIKETT